MLANEWDAESLGEWGLDVPIIMEEAELTDISDKITETFRIEIICKDEQSQQEAYNKLIEEGYECRLLTL
jgi:hypothetical protein